jgi:hypothetical protein
MSTNVSVLDELLEDFRAERTFRLSAAWRPKGSAALVVPVIRTVARVRGYLTIQEAKEIEISDTGDIGRVEVRNGEKVPVFVRVGSLLEGKGTQSRAVNKSIIIAPGETVDVGVNCVHHSHSIDPSASFAAVKTHLAPAAVERHLVRGDQGGVWAAVQGFTSAKQAMSGSQTGLGASDNLVGEFDSADKFTEMVDRLVKEIPNHEGQVGVVIFDERGVYGVELFDSPDSWKVFNAAVVEKFGELLLGRFDERVLEVKVREEKVTESVMSFLDGLRESQLSVDESGGCGTVQIGGKYSGEVSFDADRFVHLTAVRGDEGLEA